MDGSSLPSLVCQCVNNVNNGINMKPQFFSITIGGQKHIVAVLDLNADQTIGTAPKRTHRIQILDRSYSMAYELDSVVNQTQKSVSIMDGKDLVSTFWFSSPGQFGHVVVGASPGDDVQRLLESMRRPVGSTCFSEVLAEVEKIMVQFQGLVDQTVIDLFTDGMPVVPWGGAEERLRVETAVKSIVEKGNVSAFNTIGYGSYYDREFLNKVAELSEFGAFTHTSNIESFFSTIQHNMKVSQNFVVRKTEVIGPDGSEVLYLSPGNSMRLSDKELHLSRLDANANFVYVIMPERDTTVLVNNEVFAPEGKVGASFDEAKKEDFLYAYAAEAFRRGDGLKSVDILVNNLRDKALATQAFSSFTIEEMGNAQNAIVGAFMDVSKRWVGGKTGPGFMPAKDALCVMDVLDAMIKSETEVYYLPLQKGVATYERIGRKAVDAENRFTPKSYDLQAEVGELVWNKEKLNLSLRFTRDGVLKLNPKSADAVGLPHTRDIFTWQSHSFVKDGNVNVKQAAFLLPEALFNDLVKRGVKLSTVTVEGTLIAASMMEVKDDKNYVRAVIDFSKLPIINRTYIDKSASIDDLYAATINIKRTEAAQKVAKFLLDEVKESNANMLKVGAFEGLKAEQIRVLTEHGMREDGSYGGVAKTVAKVEDADSYEARFIEFDLKGAATLPSISEMLEMKAGVSSTNKAKVTNLPGKYMIEAWDAVHADLTAHGFSIDKPTVALRDYLKAGLKAIKTRLGAERNALNVLKLAKTLTGDGFKGLEPNAKGQLEYTAPTSVTETMLIKITRKPVAIDMAA